MAFTAEQRERIRERTIAERAAQGLPPTVVDPVALATIARLVTSSTGRSASRPVRPAESVVGQRGNLSGDAA